MFITSETQNHVIKGLSSIRHLYIFYLCCLAPYWLYWGLSVFPVCDWLRTISCGVMRPSWSRWAWSWRSTAKTRLRLTPKAASGRSSDLKSTTSLMRYVWAAFVNSSEIKPNIGSVSIPWLWVQVYAFCPPPSFVLRAEDSIWDLHQPSAGQNVCWDRWPWEDRVQYVGRPDHGC